MNKQIKVLQVAPLGSGGVTSLILNVAGALDNTKIHFDYLTFYDRTEFNEERALAMGGKKYVVPIDHYKNPIVRSVFKFLYAIKVIRKSQADIIHINGSKPYDVLVGVSAKFAGVKKVIFHSHNSSMDKTKGVKKVIMRVMRNVIPIVSDCNLACSKMAAEFMFPNSILVSKDYKIIKNAIDVERYRFSDDVRDAYRKTMSLEDCFVISHVGRFMPQKNHKGLIDIFEEIHKKEPKSVLLLIGEGVLFEEIKAYVKGKGLDDTVRFIGATQEVPQLLQASDCFLLPSFFEGLPVVGVEVQASGLPIVMADTITKEVDLTDHTNYISLSESLDVWADAVLSYVNKQFDRSVYADYISKAGFNIQVIADRMTAIYEQLMDEC